MFESIKNENTRKQLRALYQQNIETVEKTHEVMGSLFQEINVINKNLLKDFMMNPHHYMPSVAGGKKAGSANSHSANGDHTNINQTIVNMKEGCKKLVAHAHDVASSVQKSTSELVGLYKQNWHASWERMSEWAQAFEL